MDQEIRKFRSNLGKRIRQERIKQKLDQSELAAMINKDKQVINRYEKNGANPTVYILAAIARALKVTTDELLEFSKLGKDLTI